MYERRGQEMATNISNDDIYFEGDSPLNVCFTLFTPEAVHNTHGLVLITGYLVIAVFVFITNTALLVGIFKTNNTLTLAQRLFVLMSLLDLVIGLVFLPLQSYMIYIAEKQECGLIMIQAFVSMFFPFMSGLVLLLIVVHRFFLVMNTAFTKKLAHRRNIRLCLVFSTIFATMMSTWYVFQKRTSDSIAHGVYYLTAGIITTGYLLSVMLVNLRLICFLKAAAKTGASRASVSNMSRESYHKRVSKTLVLMSAVVTLCYIPMAVSFILSGLFLLFEQHDYMGIVQIIIPWSQMLMTSNSALNSYIYIKRTRSLSEYYQRLMKDYCLFKPLLR